MKNNQKITISINGYGNFLFKKNNNSLVFWQLKQRKGYLPC